MIKATDVLEYFRPRATRAIDNEYRVYQ